LFQGGGEFLLYGSLSFSGWGLYFIIPITRSSIFFLTKSSEAESKL
jgi:hypothetical protein